MDRTRIVQSNRHIGCGLAHTFIQEKSMNHTASLVTACACLLAGASLLAPAWCQAKSIAKDQVNLRTGPSQDSEILLVAPQGYPIEVVKKSGQWTQFRDWQDNLGWVYSPLVSNIDTAVIQVENANIRTGEGTSSPVAASAAMGEIYRILGKKGDWVQLGYYETSTPFGWIRSDLVFGE